MLSTILVALCLTAPFDRDALHAPVFSYRDNQLIFWSYSSQDYHNAAGNSVICLLQDGRESVWAYETRWVWERERAVQINCCGTGNVRRELHTPECRGASNQDHGDCGSSPASSVSSRTVAGVLLKWDGTHFEFSFDRDALAARLKKLREFRESRIKHRRADRDGSPNQGEAGDP